MSQSEMTTASTGTYDVKSPVIPGTSSFQVYDNDQVIGDTFRRNEWWESWMHEKFKETSAVHCKEGDVVLDIGANMGSHSVALSKLLPNMKIMAFEPQRHVCTLLKNNVKLNGANNVDIYCHALSDHEGTSRFKKYDPATDKRNQGAQQINANFDGEEVKLRQLDTILEEHGNPRVCMVKIDVEGHERNVLNGARKMMARDKPPIYFEDWGQETCNYLRNLNYEITDLKDAGGRNDYFATQSDEKSGGDVGIWVGVIVVCVLLLLVGILS